jgi:hypothetical protein
MKLKLLFFSVLIIPFLINAQSKYEEEARSFFWGKDDAYKNITEVPEKWKNESAVILCKNVNYDYHKFGKSVTYKTSIRQRIKLLDKLSVSEFSDFSFKKTFYSSKGTGFSYFRSKGKVIVGIKIIKENGKEIIIDVEKESVNVDGESKLAIANLEVGDIIDYYTFIVEPFKSKRQYGFQPVERTLSEEYPVVDFKLSFETENDFFINFNSYNGAPDLKQITSDKKRVRKYELITHNLEKQEKYQWVYPLVQFPSYKFQVYFARSGRFEEDSSAFLPEKEDIIKRTVSKEEVLDFYKNRLRPFGKVGEVQKFLKKKEFKNIGEKVKEAFYYTRYHYLTRFIEPSAIRSAQILYDPFIYYGSRATAILEQEQFVKFFTMYLYKEKIPYSIIVAKNQYDGGLNDLLLENNLQLFLKVELEDPIYLNMNGVHTTVNNHSRFLDNTVVYKIICKKNGDLSAIEEDRISERSYKKNVFSKEINLSITDDFEKLTVNATSSYSGFYKQTELYNKLIFSDYVYADAGKYQEKSFLDYIKGKRSKRTYGDKLDALVEKNKNDQKENFKLYAAVDVKTEDGIKDYEYEILKTGRYHLDSLFKFKESFTVKNEMVKKVGRNRILEIGKAIGPQVYFEESKRERKHDVYMEFARSINYSITFEIPHGYKVVGLDKLIKHVDNKAGAFISSAWVDQGKVFIETSKQYKHKYLDHKDWNLMLQFLDKASQFTNEKILLKKL